MFYALPAQGGFLSSDLLNKIDSILRKAHKFGYTEVLKVTYMMQNADNKLFSLMFWFGHCLRRDAFSGQSRSTNIVPFHILGIVS